MTVSPTLVSDLQHGHSRFREGNNTSYLLKYTKGNTWINKIDEYYSQLCVCTNLFTDEDHVTKICACVWE